MESRKLTKADLDKVRNIEGFPIVEEFIEENGTKYDEAFDDYHREPFTADVSEGKNDPIYGSHNYHTKVPPKAIMRYLLHYTNPGDVVLDGFSGSGMTGVAVKKCGNPDSVFRMQIEHEMPGVKWGRRKAMTHLLMKWKRAGRSLRG